MRGLRVVEHLSVFGFAILCRKPLHRRSFGQGVSIVPGSPVESSFQVGPNGDRASCPLLTARDCLRCRSIRGRPPGSDRNSVDAAILVAAAAPAGSCFNRLAGEPPGTLRGRAAAIGERTRNPLKATPPLGPGSFSSAQDKSGHRPAGTAHHPPGLRGYQAIRVLHRTSFGFRDRMADSRPFCRQFRAIRMDGTTARN